MVINCWKERVTISIKVCPGDENSNGGLDNGRISTSTPNSPCSEAKKIIPSIYLDKDETEILNTTLDELLEQCGYKKIYHAIIDFDYSLEEIRIDPNSESIGGYTPEIVELIFRASSVIEEAMAEEFIYLYHDSFYTGISAFAESDCGRSNIEFEAKLFRDI